MATFGSRLRDERLRIGVATLAEFGALVGISTQVQSRYEKAEREPKMEYWAAAAACGIDVLYVITGRREVTEITSDEADLLRRYRDAPDAVKAAALGALIGGASPAGVQQTFHSGVNIGQNVTGDVTGPATFTFGSGKKKK